MFLIGLLIFSLIIFSSVKYTTPDRNRCFPYKFNVYLSFNVCFKDVFFTRGSKLTRTINELFNAMDQFAK